MEKKGTSKMAAWLGLGLGALALFLVVYTQWLGPTMEANRIKAETQKAERQSEERRQTYQDFRGSGTLKEYASGEKTVDIAAAAEKSREELVNNFNEAFYHRESGHDIDPDSIVFLDLYFGPNLTKEDLKADVVVRYCGVCVDGEKFYTTACYDMPPDMRQELSMLYVRGEPLPVLIGYLYEYRDDIQLDSFKPAGYTDEYYDRIVAQGQDEAALYYDAESFYYEMGITTD